MPPITSYFSVATPEQAAEQASRGFEQIQHHIRWEKAHKISDDAAKAQHIRESANERQQRRRLRLKQSEAHLGLRDRETLRKVKPMKLQSPPSDSPGTPAPVNVDPAAKAVPVKRRRAPRTNWYEPTRWTLIATAAKRVGFSSPQGIVHQLQVGANGELFKTLDRGTVAAWINDKRTGWTQAVLDRVARVADGEAPRVVNPEQPLGRRPFLIISLIASIVLLLTNMRNAGMIITMAVAQSVVLAFIRQEAPELLDNPKFKCSRKFVRRILADKLDWSWRAVTQAAQKLPDDWEQQCLDFAHWLTWNITMNKIPPELVINADQTGVSYLGTGARTWELKGSSQVSAVGQGEKRQFTLMVAATAAGKLLPLQAIYKGKTSNSLPSKAARDTCEHAQFLFTPGGEKHWSNLETMKVVTLQLQVST
ncbi:hypothetical protein FRC12_023375 [Ceratobasidium sp. 428]|nr:hypothetical protein FRC12_023375 [Ceratobasidium sp. 428]